MKKIELDKALLMVRGFDAETAEQISVAVNSHEELLDAAKQIIVTIAAEQMIHGLSDYTEGFVMAYDKLDKAIAKAESRP